MVHLRILSSSKRSVCCACSQSPKYNTLGTISPGYLHYTLSSAENLKPANCWGQHLHGNVLPRLFTALFFTEALHRNGKAFAKPSNLRSTCNLNELRFSHIHEVMCSRKCQHTESIGCHADARTPPCRWPGTLHACHWPEKLQQDGPFSASSLHTR